MLDQEVPPQTRTDAAPRTSQQRGAVILTGYSPYFYIVKGLMSPLSPIYILANEYIYIGDMSPLMATSGLLVASRVQSQSRLRARIAVSRGQEVAERRQAKCNAKCSAKDDDRDAQRMANGSSGSASGDNAVPV